jgi:transglutaminase-like putative cysteine protease
MATAMRHPLVTGSAETSGLRLSALARYADVSLFLLLSNSVLALEWTGKLDPITMALAPAALLFKAVRHWMRKGPELSARTATIFVVAYLPFYPLDLLVFSRDFAAGAPNAGLYAALHASIHLMLYVLVVRLYSATKTRDQLFLAMMATASLLAAAIFTVDTAFVIFLLAFLVLGVSTFMAIEMLRSAEGAVAPPLEAGTPAASRLGRALALTALGLTLGTALLGSAIFLILPRFPAGYLGGLNFSNTMISGFSDNVELGRIGEIKLNPAVVMRTKMSVSAESAPFMRWRGVVLTTFDGHRWFTEKTEPPTPIPPDNEGWYSVGPAMPVYNPAQFRPVHYTVLLEPMATDALFVLSHPVALRGTFQQESEHRSRDNRPVVVMMDRTDSLFNPYNNFSKMYYEGQSMLPLLQADALRASGTNYPTDKLDLKMYTQLPEKLDDRIPKLAREIVARATTPYDRAAAIEIYLRTRFGYTLQQPDPVPADPLANFLFRRQAGHCEYFATAMTVLVRTLGIPARYVNGFLPGEYNDVGDSYIVRGSDAHSWVEVYFPGYGWIPFDPTPPAGQKPRFFLGRLAYYWDWIELSWNEWVVNYTAHQQISLAASATRATREWGNRSRAYLEGQYRRAVEWLKRLHFTARGMIRQRPVALLGMALLLSLLLLILLRGRVLIELFSELRMRGGFGAGTGPAAAPRIATIYYARLLRLLERRGLRKAEGQTPLEFAAAVPAGELAAQVVQLTECYQAARFGASSTDLREMAHQLGAIRATLRSS